MHSVKGIIFLEEKQKMKDENFDFYRNHSLRDVPISKHFEKILKIPKTTTMTDFLACVSMRDYKSSTLLDKGSLTCKIHNL